MQGSGNSRGSAETLQIGDWPVLEVVGAQGLKPLTLFTVPLNCNPWGQSGAQGLEPRTSWK